MNKLNKKVYISLLIILLASHTGFAHENRDFETWSSVAVDYKPNKNGHLDWKENCA